MLTSWDRASWARSLMRVNCALLTMITPLILPIEHARAEVTVRNDTLEPGNQGVIQAGFVAGDVGAAVFELPEGVDALRIKRVQILFLSSPDNALHTFGSVHLYCATLPDPGPPLRTVGGIALNPDYLNELDVSNEGWLVQRGDGPFAIGFEYLWKVGGAIDAASGHLVTDNDGCQSGRNMAYDAGTSSWVDPCQFTNGDFIIRVIGDPLESKAPFGDFDEDGDVDQQDFAAFQRCVTGPIGSASGECAAIFDCDSDQNVDADDFEQFVACARGATVPADPSCGSCLPLGLCTDGLVSWLLRIKPDQEKHQEARLAWIGYLILVIVLIAAGVWIKGCFNSLQLSAKQSAFMSAASPVDQQDLTKVGQAILHLRDTLGANDPEARRAGQYLWDFGYHTNCCLIQKVPLNENPSNLIAVKELGTNVIIISEEYLTYRYSKESLAMILYSEWCHIDDPGINKEDDQQDRLRAFRQRHGYEQLLPEMKHGASEGEAE